MSVILGIDYGNKRIGVARADLETRIALPMQVVEGRNDPTRDARNLADLGKAEGATAFVVGLPLNMDGSDSAQTQRCRAFASELARLSGMAVHLQDERLTSYVADEVLDVAAVPQAKRRGLTDRIAAQKILQAYLARAAP